MNGSEIDGVTSASSHMRTEMGQGLIRGAEFWDCIAHEAAKGVRLPYVGEDFSQTKLRLIASIGVFETLARSSRRSTNGSPSWTRTSDHSINSRMLYQLSYRGSRRRGAYSTIWRLEKRLNPPDPGF